MLFWLAAPAPLAQAADDAGFQNLLDDRHAEAMPEYFPDIWEARRGAYGKVSWSF
jgi:hypothetical protein